MAPKIISLSSAPFNWILLLSPSPTHWFSMNSISRPPSSTYIPPPPSSLLQNHFGSAPVTHPPRPLTEDGVEFHREPSRCFLQSSAAAPPPAWWTWACLQRVGAWLHSPGRLSKLSSWPPPPTPPANLSWIHGAQLRDCRGHLQGVSMMQTCVWACVCACVKSADHNTSNGLMGSGSGQGVFFHLRVWRDKSNMDEGTKNTHAHGSESDPCQDSISSAFQGKQRDKIPARGLCAKRRSGVHRQLLKHHRRFVFRKASQSKWIVSQICNGGTNERENGAFGLFAQLFVQRAVSCRSLWRENTCNYWTHGLE